MLSFGDTSLEGFSHAIPATLLSRSRMHGQIYTKVDLWSGQELIGSVVEGMLWDVTLRWLA